MTRYRIEVREVVFHTFEIETDLTDPDEIESFFYDMEDQENHLVESFPHEWFVNEIRKMGDEP
jgi:hypothetical protein